MTTTRIRTRQATTCHGSGEPVARNHFRMSTVRDIIDDAHHREGASIVTRCYVADAQRSLRLAGSRCPETPVGSFRPKRNAWHLVPWVVDVQP